MGHYSLSAKDTSVGDGAQDVVATNNAGIRSVSIDLSIRSLLL